MNLGLGIGPTFIGPAFLWSPSRLRVGTRVVRDLTLRPNRMYSDVAGTTPIAGPGAEVAAIRDSRGVLVATQTDFAAQPIFAREPAGGVRNRANGSAAVGIATYWPASAVQSGVTMTKIASGIDAQGRAFVDLQYQGTPSAASHNLAYAGFSHGMIPAGVGTVATSSFQFERIAGTATGVTGCRATIVERSAVDAFLLFAAGSLSLGATETTVSFTKTAVEATVAKLETSIQMLFVIGTPVDVTFRVTALQFETGSTRTAWQRNLSAFDVTEAGQRDLYALWRDGFDDFMPLETPFAPTGDFTMAAAFDHRAGADSLGIFGGPNTRFGQASSNQPRIDANLSANRTQFTEQSNGRGVLVVRSVGSGAAQGWRNGVSLTPALTGSMRPLAPPGFTDLFRSAATISSAGRFYGGVLIDEGDTPLTEAERLMMQNYLAYNGGVTL